MMQQRVPQSRRWVVVHSIYQGGLEPDLVSRRDNSYTFVQDSKRALILEDVKTTAIKIEKDRDGELIVKRRHCIEREILFLRH
jgi:hypothetical protein